MSLTKKILNFSTISIVLSIFIFSSCNSRDRLDPKEFKQKDKLVSLGYDFTADTFVKVIKNGELDVVRLFIKSGMSPDTKIKLGNYNIPVIFYALENKKENVVRLLVDMGADLESSAAGVTVLMKAVEKAEVETLKLMIEKGVNVNKFGEMGLTPLMTAIEKGNDGAAWLLINSKADINAKDRLGITPLMRAVREGNVDIVKELIKRGADINAESKRGLKVYSLITDKNREALEILLEKAKPAENN